MTAMRHGLLCVASLVTVFGTSLSAEPITAVYQINVIQRFDYQRWTYEPFSSVFALTLSFDSRFEEFVSPRGDQLLRVYSPPAFSSVPHELIGAQAPLGLELREHKSLTDQWFQYQGGYHRQMMAEVVVTDEAFSGFYRALTLWRPSLAPLLSPPELSTFSMVHGLGAGDYAGAFAYTIRGLTPEGEYLPNSFAYLGYSSLLSHNAPDHAPAPIPEPTTLLLFGTGLVVARQLRSASRRSR